jgi:hypothetical protein
MPFRPLPAAARRRPLQIACIALAIVALALSACREEGIEPGRPRGSSKKAEAPAIALDCDDLPALTPEELARPPRSHLLDRTAPTGPREPLLYTLLPDVTLSEEVAAKVARIDEAFARRTREHLVITSGQRDSARQAKAMYKMLELGADIMRLYRNKAAAREILGAYEADRGKEPSIIVGALHAVIKDQMARGIYISAHLRDGAVDVRSRSMSASERQAFAKAVAEVGGVSLLEESKPPHYHLQIE